MNDIVQNQSCRVSRVSADVHKSASPHQSVININDDVNNDDNSSARVSMRANEIDVLKAEVARLHDQLAKISIDCVSASKNNEQLPKVQTSTPQRKVQTANIFDPQVSPHVRSRNLDTQYLSAISANDSSIGSEYYQPPPVSNSVRELQQQRECKQTQSGANVFGQQFATPPLISPPYQGQQFGMQQQQFRSPIQQQQWPQYVPKMQQFHQQQPQQFQQQQPQQFQQQQPQQFHQQPQQFYQQQPQQPQQFFNQQQQIQQQIDANTQGFHQFLSRQGAKDLPRFDGNPDDWLLFSTQFWRTTQMCNFSMDENLLRLQRCLHGSAREAVRSLLVLPQNINVIMERL